MVEQMNTEEALETFENNWEVTKEEVDMLDSIKGLDSMEKIFEVEQLKDLSDAVESERVQLSLWEGYLEKSELINAVSDKIQNTLSIIEQSKENSSGVEVVQREESGQEDKLADGSGMLDNTTDKIRDRRERLDEVVQNIRNDKGFYDK